MRASIPLQSILLLFAGSLMVAPLLAQDVPPAAEPANPPAVEPVEPAPAPTETPSTERIETAIAALQSDDFQTRERALAEIWLMGRAGEERLRKAVAEGGAEMRYRGGRVLEEFDLGIYPDTPEAIRRLVKRYRTGDAAQRETVVNELAKLGETDLLIRLVKRERDEKMRAAIARLVAKNITEEVPQKILTGNLDDAENLLRTGALNSYGMRNYAAFLMLTERLPKAVSAQRKVAGNSEIDSELYAWLLRADGRYEEAAEVFSGMGKENEALYARAAGGDQRSYALTYIDPSRRTADILGYQALVAKLEGDDATFKAKIKELSDFAVAMPDEADRCLIALILNDEAERAFQLAKEIAPDELLDMELWRYDFDAAFAALGVEPSKESYTTWLDGFLPGLDNAGDHQNGLEGAVRPVGRLAGAAMLIGQAKEAEELVRSAARKLEANGDTLEPLIRWERFIGLDKLAREHAVKSMEVDLESTVVKSLYLGALPANYEWLATRSWNFLRENYPDDSNAAALQRMGTLFDFDSNGNPTGDPAPVIAKIKAAATDAPVDARKELLQMLHALARLHQDWNTAADAQGEWLPLAGEDLSAAYHYNRYAECLLNAERFEEAAREYQRAFEMTPSNPVPLYYKAVALEKSGKKEEAEKLKRAAELLALGDVSRHHFLAGAMWIHEDEERARSTDRLIRRFANPGEHAHADALRRTYADRRVHGSAKEAADALEGYLLTHMRPVNSRSLLSRRAALAYIVELKGLRAKQALTEGDADKAHRLILTAQAINPSDSSMLEDIHQLLLDAGKTTEAGQLFETTYKVSKAAADRFPDKGQHHNNLAWLLSRCGKKLDDALKHANRAVEMEPDNGAFLDTLAEVHFQRGDRAKAVAASEKAVALLDDDVQVLRQLERFKTGDPTDR